MLVRVTYTFSLIVNWNQHVLCLMTRGTTTLKSQMVHFTNITGYSRIVSQFSAQIKNYPLKFHTANLLSSPYQKLPSRTWFFQYCEMGAFLLLASPGKVIVAVLQMRGNDQSIYATFRCGVQKINSNEDANWTFHPFAAPKKGKNILKGLT